MRVAGPTIAELNARVQKGRHREIGNWLARRVARPSAVYGCWLAVRLGVSANQVTLLSLLCSIGAAVVIGSGDRTAFVIGVLFLHLAFWLDHVDGQVARWNGTASLDGVYLDYIMHHLANLCLGFALGYGLVMLRDDARWSIAGFAISLGWALLGLHNDCRYKAFFQRLKAADGNFRVEGGGGGRPIPPAPWPRHGIAALTWPAYKICEPHVVLGVLTVMAVVAFISPDAWATAWTWLALAMAIFAPLLGVARVARSLARSSVENEFQRWFRPTDGQAGA
jgi:phosphatidylglycerophosphate synthase